MMSKETAQKREQIQFISMEDLVPSDHLLRKVEKAEDKYCLDNGRPSLDPVILIKMAVIHCQRRDENE